MHTRTPSRTVCLLLAVLGLNILLGCASFKQGTQNAMHRIRGTNPVDDFYEDEYEDEDPDVQAATGSNSSIAQPASSSPRKGPFFDIPEQWKIVKGTKASARYKLKHTSDDSTSMVITRVPWDGDDAQRQDALRRSHQTVIGQMPAVYKKKEYREWIADDESSRIMTALQGKKAKDAPLMTILGYSVGIEQDNYMVFAAFPSETSREDDILLLVDSLRPTPKTPAAEKQAEGDVPKPAKP